jgi:hypothetical protein
LLCAGYSAADTAGSDAVLYRRRQGEPWDFSGNGEGAARRPAPTGQDIQDVVEFLKSLSGDMPENAGPPQEQPAADGSS